MLNKRSSKLIAWIMTLVMLFNIAPFSAFAQEDEGVTIVPDDTSINTVNTPDYIVRDVTNIATVAVSDGKMTVTVPERADLPKDSTRGEMVYTVPSGINITAEMLDTLPAIPSLLHIMQRRIK